MAPADPGIKDLIRELGWPSLPALRPPVPAGDRVAAPSRRVDAVRSPLHAWRSMFMSSIWTIKCLPTSRAATFHR